MAFQFEGSWQNYSPYKTIEVPGCVTKEEVESVVVKSTGDKTGKRPLINSLLSLIKGDPGKITVRKGLHQVERHKNSEFMHITLFFVNEGRYETFHYYVWTKINANDGLRKSQFDLHKISSALPNATTRLTLAEPFP